MLPHKSPGFSGLFLSETAISLFIHRNFKGMWYRRLEMMPLVGKKDIMKRNEKGNRYGNFDDRRQ